MGEIRLSFSFLPTILPVFSEILLYGRISFQTWIFCASAEKWRGIRTVDHCQTCPCPKTLWNSVHVYSFPLEWDSPWSDPLKLVQLLSLRSMSEHYEVLKDGANFQCWASLWASNDFRSFFCASFSWMRHYGPLAYSANLHTCLLTDLDLLGCICDFACQHPLNKWFSRMK